MSYLLDHLQKLDKKIVEAEKALVYLNKQAGSKLQKISQLKEERKLAAEAYKKETE